MDKCLSETKKTGTQKECQGLENPTDLVKKFVAYKDTLVPLKDFTLSKTIIHGAMGGIYLLGAGLSFVEKVRLAAGDASMVAPEAGVAEQSPEDNVAVNGLAVKTAKSVTKGSKASGKAASKGAKAAGAAAAAPIVAADKAGDAALKPPFSGPSMPKTRALLALAGAALTGTQLIQDFPQMEKAKTRLKRVCKTIKLLKKLASEKSVQGQDTPQIAPPGNLLQTPAFVPPALTNVGLEESQPLAKEIKKALKKNKLKEFGFEDGLNFNTTPLDVLDKIQQLAKEGNILEVGRQLQSELPGLAKAIRQNREIAKNLANQIREQDPSFPSFEQLSKDGQNLKNDFLAKFSKSARKELGGKSSGGGAGVAASGGGPIPDAPSANQQPALPQGQQAPAVAAAPAASGESNSGFDGFDLGGGFDDKGGDNFLDGLGANQTDLAMPDTADVFGKVNYNKGNFHNSGKSLWELITNRYRRSAMSDLLKKRRTKSDI